MKKRKTNKLNTIDKTIKNADDVFIGGIDSLIQHSVKHKKRK